MSENTQKEILASIKAIQEVVKADGSPISNSLLFVGKISTVLSSISLGITVLQKLGVLEEKNDIILEKLTLISTEIHQRFNEIENTLKRLDVKADLYQWTEFLREYQRCSREAVEALKTQSFNGQTKQIEVTVNNDIQTLDKWGEKYRATGTKILADFHEYILEGLPIPLSSSSLLEDIIAVYRSIEGKQQSVYYYVHNYSVHLLFLYTTIYYGCKLTMTETISASRDIKNFENLTIKSFFEIERKQQEVLEKMEESDKCYTNQDDIQKKVKVFDDSIHLFGDSTIQYNGFGTAKEVIPKTENYKNFVVTGIRLIEGMAIGHNPSLLPSNPSNPSNFYVCIPIIRLQLKIGKIGSNLSISEEEWMEPSGKLVRTLDYAYPLTIGISEEDFQKLSNSSAEHALPTVRATEEAAFIPGENNKFKTKTKYFTNEPAVPEGDNYEKNIIMIMTGAQIMVNENRFVLITYSSPLDITDIGNPVLNREVENCSKPKFTTSNYFGLQEPSSSEGHNVEYVEMIEIAPPIHTPLRGASFYNRGNNVSIRLRTDLPLHKLASLKPCIVSVDESI